MTVDKMQNSDQVNIDGLCAHSVDESLRPSTALTT
jgi:hypothetical protein